MAKKKHTKKVDSKKTSVHIVIAVLIIITATSLLYSHHITKERKNYVDALTFSSTASWGEHLLREIHKFKASTHYQANQFEITPPPKNTSKETEIELNYLLSLKSERSPEKIKEIEQEQFIYGMNFNNVPLTDYFNPLKYNFAEDFEKEFWEISTIVLTEKQTFDRVRPHILNPEIQPTITVPPHPAYPSGHATQAYFAALYLSEQYPELESQFFTDAKRIAHNREIAGVHYPSDTAAGKILAESFFKLQK